MNRLREIGQNVKKLVKMVKFWSKKGPKKGQQASDAGVSRQCLEDKMSKGARNVDIGKFDITQPLKGSKYGSHGPK